MDLDQGVLEEVMRWGQALDGFNRTHASNALTIVQGYVNGVEGEDGRFVEGFGSGEHRKLCLFAIDVAWIFWLDDLFDSPRQPGRPPIDIESILRAIHGEPTTLESEGFHALRERFAHLSSTDDHGLWQDTASRTVVAWRLEQELSHKRARLSYSEYLENGINSTAVPHMMTTASMLYGFGLGSRLGEEAVQRLVRHLSISSRLNNDLCSVEKERREGSLANAVLLLAEKLPVEQAREFVVEDLQGFERMLRADIAMLDAGDPIARMGRVMPEAHRILHTDPRGSYSSTSAG
jgi:hypothetical protein